MATFIVGMVLLLIVILVVRSMYKKKKAGKSLTCGGDCANCSKNCH